MAVAGCEIAAMLSVSSAAIETGMMISANTMPPIVRGNIVGSDGVVPPTCVEKRSTWLAVMTASTAFLATLAST